MNIPILTARRERRQAQLATAIDAGVEKALSPAIAQAAAQAQASSGATYPVGRTTSSPFAQTGGYGLAYNPLPRPDQDFNSLFGPGYPLIPDPLDPLGPSGRVMPRRAQYLVSANLQLLDRQTPWTALKWMATECDIISRCIELVQDGINGREWSWGFSDDVIQQIMNESGGAITNHAKAMNVAKDKYGAELDRVTQFFKKPDPRSNHIFSQFLSELVWQALVYDGVVIYPQFTLGGDLYSLSPIDTATIKIILDNQGFPPEPPAPAYQQILYGFPRGEFQAQDGDVEGEYTHDQLAYYIRRPRPESVYGFSPVEECMGIASTYLQRQAWMRAEYSYGSTPKTYFKMAENSSAGLTPDQVWGFEQGLNDRLAGQNQRRQMAFLLPWGIEPEQMKQLEETYKSDYDNWLIQQIGSKFGVPGSQLGVQAKAGLSGGKQMEGESSQSEQFVFNALIQFFIDILNDLARRYLNVGPEITATCQNPGDNEEDILQQANADTATVSGGRITLNDWRAKNGLPLYDMPEADEPFILTGTGVQFLKGALAVQDANTENTLNPPEPPKQIMVGPDGKPLPAVPNDGGSDGNGNTDTGRESDDSGATGSQSGTAGDSKADANDQSDKTDSSGNSTVGTSDSTSSDDNDTAAEKELAAFTRFAKTRINDGKWRDFTFTTVDRVRAVELNDLGRRGEFDLIKKKSKQSDDEAIIDYSGRVILPTPLLPGDKVVIEHKHGKDDDYDLEDVDDLEKANPKATAHGKWADHPNHVLHDKIVEYYAPKLVQAIKDSTTGIQQAITVAERKAANRKNANKSLAKAGNDDAFNAVNDNVTIQPKDAADIIRQMLGDAYLAGSHVGAQMVGGGAKVLQGLEDANSAMDWDAWTPGWLQAAGTVQDGGLAALLDNVGAMLTGINGTALTRLGNVLADGIAGGDSVQTIASNMSDMVMSPARALVIANTSTAQAMTTATLATYDQNGVAQWEWLAEDDACPECDALDGQTFDVDDSGADQIPLHPSCRCAALPVIPGLQDNAQPTLESSVDDNQVTSGGDNEGES